MNINKTELRILDCLAKRPKGAYGRKISKDTGISVGAASQGLRKLEGMGMIKGYVEGRQTYYYADMENPLIRHFKVFMSILEVMPLINSLKTASKRAILYGSCAEGTDTEESDIDLFILTDSREKAKEFINKFRLKGRKISPIIKNTVELAVMKSKDRALYNNIIKGLVLWEKKDES